MTAHPLGDIDAAADIPDAKSIVDSVLDLDEFLSADVRLPERSFRIFRRPDREARINDLSAELDSLLDAQGRDLSRLASGSGPAPKPERTVGDGGTPPAPAAGGERTAGVVSAELLEEQRAYFRDSSTIRLRAMDDVTWQAFDAKWGKAFRETNVKDGEQYPPDAIAALIDATTVAPKITVDKVEGFRKRVGSPVIVELARECYQVNTQSGVSIPKSLISSVAMSRGPLG